MFALVVCRYSTLSVLSISRYWSSCSKGIVDIPPTDTGLDGTVVPRGEATPDFNAIMISVSQCKDMAGYRNYITAQHTFFFHMKIRWFWLHVCFLNPFHPLPGISEFCFNMRGVCRVFKITNRCGDGAQGLDVESWLSSGATCKMM